jgi:branched-chain amino acid transport system permease protein
MFGILPQLIINGIIAGALYALLSLGLSLSFGILGYINFAHADFAVLGGYFFYTAYVVYAQNIFVSALFSIMATTIIVLIFKKCTYDPLKNKPPIIPMLASIGVISVVQNFIQIVAGGDIKSIPRIGKNYSFFDNGITFTGMQVWQLGLSIACMMLLVLFLKKTKTGKAIRAVSDNSQAASIVGISTERITTIIFIIASILVAIGGIFISYEYSLYPSMGTMLIVKAFVPVIFGGVGNIAGTIIGAFAIGIIENIGIGLSFGSFAISANYKDAFAFLVMLFILIWKPSGLFGEKSEQAIRKA